MWYIKRERENVREKMCAAAAAEASAGWGWIFVTVDWWLQFLSLSIPSLSFFNFVQFLYLSFTLLECVCDLILQFSAFFLLYIFWPFVRSFVRSFLRSFVRSYLIQFSSLSKLFFSKIWSTKLPEEIVDSTFSTIFVAQRIEVLSIFCRKSLDVVFFPENTAHSLTLLWKASLCGWPLLLLFWNQTNK